MNPEISWYIKDNDEYAQYNDYYLGSFSNKDEISINLQVWNNRYGEDETDSIDNAKIILYFSNAEDVFLLNYCTVSIDDITVNKPEILIDKGYVDIGNLSGSINDGSDTIKNKDNFKNLKITFSNLPSNLKQGLKNLFIDIQVD